MKKCLFLILLVAFSMAQTDADDAESLLEDLFRDAQNNLKDLKDTWSQNGGLLQENVESWESTFNAQTTECENRDSIVENANDQQEENGKLIEWISVTTKSTLAKSEKLYETRCAQNRNYISGLKNDKILLRLIEFLRKAINEKDTMSLIQKREFAQILMQFMSLYKTHDTKLLLQLHVKLAQDVVSAAEGEAQPGDDQVNDADFDIDNQFDTNQRSDGEVGTGHVDDNRENIDLESYESSGNKTFAEYKSELLAILDDLESAIVIKVGTSQEDEVAAGIAAADFRIQLDKELQELDAKLYEEVVFSSKIARRVSEVSGNAERCHSQLVGVTEAYGEAQISYDSAFEKFSLKEKDMLEELAIFEYVLEQYKGSVSGDDEYRQQLDDFTADGSYDDTYDDREVDDIDFLGEEE